MTDLEAQAFIRRQTGEYLLLGITTMTTKQRERIEALDVVSEERKQWASSCVASAHRCWGWPPRQHTGRMRVLNLARGGITEVRA